MHVEQRLTQSKSANQNKKSLKLCPQQPNFSSFEFHKRKTQTKIRALGYPFSCESLSLLRVYWFLTYAIAFNKAFCYFAICVCFHSLLNKMPRTWKPLAQTLSPVALPPKFEVRKDNCILRRPSLFRDFKIYLCHIQNQRFCCWVCIC